MVEWDEGRTVSSSIWSLNSSLMGIPAVQATLRDELVLYLELNDIDNISSITLWEAAKAVLRKKIIQLASISKKANGK